VNFDPQLAGYKGSQLSPLYQRLRESLATIPGVAFVGIGAYSPQSGDSWNDGIFVDGHPPPGPKEDNGSGFERATPDYLEALGNPIVRGRGITPQDTENTRHIAVINEAFARKFFKDEDPIGKHFGRSEPGTTRLYEIVGIAKDARFLTYGLESPIGAFFFAPEVQHDVFPKAESTEGDIRSHYLHDIVIATQPGTTLPVDVVRRAIASVDPNLPVNGVLTLRSQVAGSFSQQRLIARLTSLFGILSLVLASIGLYGVTAYNAGRRTNEIGVRMALGAGRRQVIALVLKGAMALVVIGLVVGLPMTLMAGRFLGSELYGLSPYNALVTLVAAGVLGLSALVASFIPAFRASLVSPLEALRAE
jgi:predicted permease